jgi:hypothetical protein
MEGELKKPDEHPGNVLGTGLCRYLPVSKDDEIRDSQWDSVNQRDTAESKGISSESEMSEGLPVPNDASSYCHNLCDCSQQEDGDTCMSTESPLEVRGCWDGVVPDTDEPPRRPRRKAACKVNYVFSSDSNNEDDVATRTDESSALQCSVTITQFFSYVGSDTKMNSGSDETAGDEDRLHHESDTKSEVESNRANVELINEMDDAEGDSEKSPSLLQEHNVASSKEPSPRISSQQIADGALPMLVCDESTRNNCKECFSQTTHFPITKFFYPTVKATSKPRSPQSDKEESQTTENTEDENENDEEIENERTVCEAAHYTKEDEESDEKGDENEETSIQEEKAMVTHMSASTANSQASESTTSGEERDSDKEEKSKQPSTYSILKFLTPVVTPVEIPSYEEDNDNYDKSDANDRENWALITEVLMPSSEYQSLPSCHTFLTQSEMSMPDVLSKIREIQSKSFPDDLHQPLEVSVIIDNSREDLPNVHSSTEESTDEDYTKIMEEEGCMLRLCEPVRYCEEDLSENGLGSKADRQLRRSRDDMDFGAVKRRVEERTIVSDTDLSGESDSGLTRRSTSHLEKVEKEPESHNLFCREGTKQKKAVTRRQPLKKKRCQLISKEERLSLKENHCTNEKAAGSCIQKAGKKDRNSRLGLVCKEGREKNKRKTNSHQQKPTKMKDGNLNSMVTDEDTNDHLQENGKKDKPINCSDKEDESNCRDDTYQRRRRKRRRRLISKQELDQGEESQEVGCDIGQLEPTHGYVETSKNYTQHKRRSARLASMHNQHIVIPDPNEDSQEDGPDMSKEGIKPDKAATMKTKTPTQEACRQLFPLFCKAAKDQSNVVDINNIKSSLMTGCSEPEMSSTFPQPKANKVISQPPTANYVPFPNISHVLQYSNKTADQQPDSKGFVVRETPCLSFTDLQSLHIEPLYLGLFTSCQCKAESPAFVHVVSIEEKERQQLVDDITRSTSAIDVCAMYKKFLEEAEGCNVNVWTEVFAPCNKNEVVGNKSALAKIYKWLKGWDKSDETVKTRKEFPIKRSMALDDKEDLDWLDEDDDFVVLRQHRKRKRPLHYAIESDSESEEEDTNPCKAMLLLGRHGSGKTASVYACAKDLGLTVIELNASTGRSGRTVQASLTEATQSRHLSNIDTTDPKPGGTKTTTYDIRTEQKGKPNKLLFHPAFASFLKSGTSVNCENKKELGVASRQRKTMRNMIKSDSETDEIVKGIETDAGVSQVKDVNEKSSTKQAGYGQVVQGKGPTVVLLDDVDVVFETDTGFWSAVSSIVRTSKRPVIMTAVDESVLEKVDFPFEVIRFEQVEKVQAELLTLLQLICLAAGVHVDPDALKSLSEYYRTDIRRCINTIQFWCSTVKTDTAVPSSTAWPMHLDCLKSIQIKSSSEPNSQTKEIASTSCSPWFWASSNSFKLSSEISYQNDLEVDLLLPFLFSEYNNEGTKANSVSTRDVCYAELDTLAQWCQSMSDKDIFQYQTRQTHLNADWRCCEQPSLIDDLPVVSIDGDESLETELASSLVAASLNYSHVQFLNRLPSIYGERTGHKNGDIILDTSHLVSQQKKLEQVMASRLSLLNQVTNSLPNYLHCSQEVISTHYLPSIRAICSTEKFNKKRHTKRRR